MATRSQKEKAQLFRSLHSGAPILVLPNAWDAASARIFELAGFGAVATTSSGVAATYGRPDGQHISKEALISTTTYIAQAVDCPVSVDIEAGYGRDIAEVIQTVKAIVEAGAVGINIEDSSKGSGRALVDIAYQVELIQALCQLRDTLDIPFVINARIDAFLLAAGEPASVSEQAIKRGNAYHQAGADCLYPIGPSSVDIVTRLVQGIAGPVNILARPTSPTILELTSLGVARVSFGGGLMHAILGQLSLIAQELFTQGTYQHIAESSSAFSGFNSLWPE